MAEWRITGLRTSMLYVMRYTNQLLSWNLNGQKECGVHKSSSKQVEDGTRAQLRAEIDAYVALLYGLSRENFAYILGTFPVRKNKEIKAFGEFMSKRKCLEEYDRLKPILERKN